MKMEIDHLKSKEDSRVVKKGKLIELRGNGHLELDSLCIYSIDMKPIIRFIVDSIEDNLYDIKMRMRKTGENHNCPILITKSKYLEIKSSPRSHFLTPVNLVSEQFAFEENMITSRFNGYLISPSSELNITWKVGVPLTKESQGVWNTFKKAWSEYEENLRSNIDDQRRADEYIESLRVD